MIVRLTVLSPSQNSDSPTSRHPSNPRAQLPLLHLHGIPRTRLSPIPSTTVSGKLDTNSSPPLNHNPRHRSHRRRPPPRPNANISGLQIPRRYPADSKHATTTPPLYRTAPPHPTTMQMHYSDRHLRPGQCPPQHSHDKNSSPPHPFVRPPVPCPPLRSLPFSFSHLKLQKSANPTLRGPPSLSTIPFQARLLSPSSVHFKRIWLKRITST
jgi:hypothetical protein